MYCNSSVKSGLCDACYGFKIYRIPTTCVRIDLSVLKNMVGNTYSIFCGTTEINVIRPVYSFQMMNYEFLQITYLYFFFGNFCHLVDMLKSCDMMLCIKIQDI
jgi:hypothetical protein